MYVFFFFIPLAACDKQDCHFPFNSPGHWHWALIPEADWYNSENEDPQFAFISAESALQMMVVLRAHHLASPGLFAHTCPEFSESGLPKFGWPADGKLGRHAHGPPHIHIE